MKPTDAPKLEKYKGKTLWQEHLEQVRKENPQCKYWSEIKKKADQEWKSIKRPIIKYKNNEKPIIKKETIKETEFQIFTKNFDDTEEGKKQGYKKWKKIKLLEKQLEEEKKIIKVNPKNEDSEWIKHLKKIDIENPNIITYKELYKKACEEWYKIKKNI